MNKLTPVLLATALAAASFPVFAQDAGATLRVDSGTAMASDGGQFETANTGRPLDAGDKIMVNPGSKVTLVYGAGCTMTLSDPGVYTVPAACSKAAWVGGGNPMTASLIIIGAAALAAVGVDAMGDDVPPGPLSTGVRHF